jgi:hypothetical protein
MGAILNRISTLGADGEKHCPFLVYKIKVVSILQGLFTKKLILD